MKGSGEAVGYQLQRGGEVKRGELDALLKGGGVEWEVWNGRGARAVDIWNWTLEGVG